MSKFIKNPDEIVLEDVKMVHYETKEEAQEKWGEISKQKYRYDWYEIVDLREWME